MKRTTTSLLTAGVLLAAVGLTGSALANDDYDNPHHMMGRDHCWQQGRGPFYGGPPGHFRGDMGGLSSLADELDLSKEQRDKIRDLVRKSRTQLRDLGESLGDNRDDMEALLDDKGYGADFDKLARRQGELIGEMIILRAKTRAQIEGVLTPEQKERFRDAAGDFCETGPGPGWQRGW